MNDLTYKEEVFKLVGFWMEICRNNSVTERLVSVWVHCH
jgi:hypothetical protein